MTPLRYYQSSFTGNNLKDPSKARWQKNFYSLNQLPKKFFDGPIKMDHMNYLTIPTEQEIKNVQLLHTRWSYPYDAEFTNKLNEFSKESLNVSSLGLGELSIEDVLEIIESVFTTSFTEKDGSLSRKTIDALSTRLTRSKAASGDFSDYENALNKLKDFYAIFNTDNGFINETKIKPIIQKLEIAIKKLEEDIDKGGVTNKTAKKGYFNNVWRGQKNNQGKEKKYDDQIIGYGNNLKGRWLEKQVIDFLLKIIDVDKGVIDTANVLGPTFNILGDVKDNKKTSRTDALIVDLTKKIEISYFVDNIKKTADLETFMNDCNSVSSSSTTVSIPAGEWERLIKSGAVSGLQIKSGKNQSVINEYKITAREAYAKAGRPYVMMLDHMISWYGFGNIYATHEDYDAIFNYGISHAINYIIGIGNNYFVFRDRVVPTAIYIEEQIKLGKYMRARSKVDLKNINKEIPVDISGTPATWGKK